MTVLVTGASGFVGAALMRRLCVESRYSVRACSRSRPSVLPDCVDWIEGPELGADASWTDALAGVDVVVHLAARVHVMATADRAAVAAYHRVNVEGTEQLALESAKAGVRRLVYLSSLKVHGEQGAFSEESAIAPVDAYGESKRDAEAGLLDMGARTGLEVVVIRPPLVYGPGVKANFSSLLAAVRSGIPLPLGAIANRRSLVAVDNLVDLIVVCLAHPAAVSQAFLVSDGDDLSTPDLVRRLAAAAGCKARLVAAPVSWLRLAGRLTGRAAAVERLTGSLSADISKARRVLQWQPPVSVDEGLRRTARGTKS